MTDSHAHLTDIQFSEDLESIIKYAKDNNVNRIINCTTTIEDSIKSLQIANNNANVYTTFGIHPLDINKSEIDNNIFEKYLKNDKVIAIGEIGLDYHYSKETKKLQKTYFETQMDIAEKYALPVIVHARESINDAIDIINHFNVTGVFHCFSGNIHQLKYILDLGYYIGFDGPITFKNNNETIKNALYCPIDRIFCETDSPYLTPVPYRGKRNEPMYVKYIYEKLCEIKNMTLEEVDVIIEKNILTLFNKIK